MNASTQIRNTRIFLRALRLQATCLILIVVTHLALEVMPQAVLQIEH